MIEEEASAPAGNASTWILQKSLAHDIAALSSRATRPGELLDFIYTSPMAACISRLPLWPLPALASVLLRPSCSAGKKRDSNTCSSLEHDLRRVPRPSPPTNKRAGRASRLCVQLGACHLASQGSSSPAPVS